MEKDRKEKSVIIAVLCIALVIMSVGYASIPKNLTVSGTAEITPIWNVAIVGIKQKGDSNGDVTIHQQPQYSTTTASFNVGLKEPGDYIEYTVTVQNLGNMKAALTNKLESQEGTDAIIFSYADNNADIELEPGETHTFDVRATYDENAIGELAPAANDSKNYTLTLEYSQAN